MIDPILSKPSVVLPFNVESNMKINISFEASLPSTVGVFPVTLYDVAVNNLTYDASSLMDRVQEHLDAYHTQPL